VLLDAEFLGIVLVLVYVGAVMVLFLFVVMMLDINIEQLRKEFVGYWPLTVAVAGFPGTKDWTLIDPRRLRASTSRLVT